MQKSMCIIGILAITMNIAYSTNCTNDISIAVIQDEIRKGDIKKIAELCADVKLTKIQHETLVSYAKKIASDHHNNIIRRNIKIYSATALKVGGIVCDNSIAILAGGLLDFRGIAASLCACLANTSLKFFAKVDQAFIKILQSDFFGFYSGDKEKVKLLELITDKQRVEQNFWLTPAAVITIGSILLFIEYKAWKSQNKVKNELYSKYDTALRIVYLISALPVGETAENPQEIA